MGIKRSPTYYILPVFVTCMYLLLYIPIIILILFSFNNSNFPYVWKGFTLHWYRELWYST